MSQYTVGFIAVLLLLALFYLLVNYDCYTSLYDGPAANYFMAICKER